MSNNLYNPDRLSVGARVRCDDPELMWFNQTGVVVSKDDCSNSIERKLIQPMELSKHINDGWIKGKGKF